MGKKFKPSSLQPPSHASQGSGLRIRCPAGKFALCAAEAEVRVDGVRIAGGDGSFEFDLPQETWLDIVIIRP